MIKNKKLWTIVASCMMGGILISVGAIAISQKIEVTYKDLLKEAQENYFDVIDKTIDKNVQKKDFRFKTNDEFYSYPYGELIIDTPNLFDEKNIPYRKSIFLNKDELKSRLIKSATKKISEDGIDSWDYYDEDFFKENLLIRVAYPVYRKYVKTVFNKKTNELINTFVFSDKPKTIYEEWKNFEKDDDGPEDNFHAVVELRTKVSIFIPFKKSDLNSDDLENISLSGSFLNRKIDLWNFLKEEKKTKQF